MGTVLRVAVIIVATVAAGIALSFGLLLMTSVVLVTEFSRRRTVAVLAGADAEART